jgi:1,4-dihydroxy-2-naphthoate octaprenyltransferase
MGMMLLQYVAVLYLVVIGFFSPVMLIVLLALPALRLAARVYRQPKPAVAPPEYPASAWPLWFVAFAFLHNRRFGLLFLLGLVGDVALHRFGIL